MIAIVDYDSGNIQAVKNIYDRLGIEAYFARTPEELENATKIVLPGVGAFDQSVQKLEQSGMKDKLNNLVLDNGVPVLGICVGMQIMAKTSEEGAGQGLGWFDAKVRHFDESRITHKPKIPHMGWNSISLIKQDPLLENIDFEQGFYFLHSYYFECQNQDDVLLESNYAGKFHCAVKKDNIYGFQFHPEKSHSNGISLFQNFARL